MNEHEPTRPLFLVVIDEDGGGVSDRQCAKVAGDLNGQGRPRRCPSFQPIMAVKARSSGCLLLVEGGYSDDGIWCRKPTRPIKIPCCVMVTCVQPRVFRHRIPLHGCARSCRDAVVRGLSARLSAGTGMLSARVAKSTAPRHECKFTSQSPGGDRERGLVTGSARKA